MKRFCTTEPPLIGARDIKYFASTTEEVIQLVDGSLNQLNIQKPKCHTAYLEVLKKKNIKPIGKHHHTISIKLLCDYILILHSALTALYFSTTTSRKKQTKTQRKTGNGNHGTEWNVTEQIKIIHWEAAYRTKILYTVKGTGTTYSLFLTLQGGTCRKYRRTGSKQSSVQHTIISGSHYHGILLRSKL